MDFCSGASEMTVRDYMRILFRQKNVIVATFLFSVIAALMAVELKTPIYRAKAKVFVPSRDNSAPLGNVPTQTEFIISVPVMERVVKEADLCSVPLDYEKRYCAPLRAVFVELQADTVMKKLRSLSHEQAQMLLFRYAVGNIRERTEVVRLRDTNIITISVRDFDPRRAALLANAIASSYIAVMGDSGIRLLEQAQPPARPIGASPMALFTATCLIGALLGGVLAFAFEYAEQTFKSPRDVETYLNLPFLGSIPKRKAAEKIMIADLKKGDGAYAHFYQNLSDQIFLLLRDKHLKTILFTSALRHEGTSTVIANLAFYLSRKIGHKVLVIDANLRAPALHKILEVSDNPGLAEIIEEKAHFEKAIQDLGHKLSLLPSGKTELNPITLLDSSKMGEILRRAREKYEVTLIDCADLRSSKDAVAICSHVDSVLIIISESQTRCQVVKSAIAPLREKRANLLGVVLNNRTFHIPHSIYTRI